MTLNPQEDVNAIVLMERKALDAWCKGDPSGFLAISAPDVVYFDPFLEKRLGSLDALRKYYEGLRGTVSAESWELIDPLVQRVGDAGAVLTFNFASRDGSGGEHRWNCTEVFRRERDQWRIIQTHWSLTKPGG